MQALYWKSCHSNSNNRNLYRRLIPLLSHKCASLTCRPHCWLHPQQSRIIHNSRLSDSRITQIVVDWFSHKFQKHRQILHWETISYILQVTWIQEFPLLYPFVIYKILQLHCVRKKDAALFLPLNGGIFYYHFARNLLQSLSVEEFWKLVQIWQRQMQNYNDTCFFRHGV